MNDERFPALALDEWEDTKTTLHLFTQIVGKVRLTAHPPVNHWWHVTFYVSPRGLTTASIPHRGRSFEMAFDLIDHEFVLTTSDGDRRTLALGHRSVGDFYREFRSLLAAKRIAVKILPLPFDPSRVKSTTPFARDDEHATYDPEAVARFHRILVEVDGLLHTFRGRFVGKCSPVHFFWHSFDLAVTRFSGRTAPVSGEADVVTREAYSHEVCSAGFWFGDDNLRAPAFYSYTHPEPEGLSSAPLRPAPAFWNTDSGSAMALLRYDDVRTSTDPEGDVLAFLQSTYEAGASRAQWPRAELELSSA